MGVIVEIAENWRTCNGCGSKENVVNITVLRRTGKSKQGTQIALCESCAQKLRFALNSRYKGYGVSEE